MKRTMVWPPVLVAGRAQMTPKPEEDIENEALQQLLVWVVQDAATMHPWTRQRRLGITDRTFSSARVKDQALLSADIRTRFSELERNRRARLVSLEIVYEKGELSAKLGYEDLERGGRKDLGVSLNG